MPRCPNCDFHSATVTDFVYSHNPYTEEEGHDLAPERGVETYLVCPDCGVLVG